MNESKESAAEYSKRSANYQFKYYEKLIDKIPFNDTDHVFEIGCGTGEMTARIAKEIVPNGQITACDPQLNRIQFAMEKFSDIPNLHFIHAKGSAALENNVNLYDVIVSNGVLHWMKEEELRKTMVNMFNALKSGGIAAHNFAEDIPNTYRTLLKIDDSQATRFFEMVHLIEKEKFADLAREVGFVTVSSERFTFVSEFDTEDDILKTADATTYGLFGWEKLYSDAKSRGLQVKFDVSDAGKPIEVIKLDNFVLKKP